uniref:dynein axonemal assembly factor 11-like n=1 Tax=Solea senegalensis TaxID=28829 RepID=UPI001CD83E1D|nr:dynein axonemal assembly factor 11-like [Solea senegalensis]
MVYITEDMVRRRAEHNESEIFSLEEVSLHQQDIEKIEHLGTWCRELKILYLQNNLIDRMENLSRLKKLQYLNLALNNIEVIENLEGCESLQKLDLTVNFIGRLSSVETLRHNVHLRELFLVGNPCAEFQGYRQYVVTSLAQLKWLDGTKISRSERIGACQGLEEVRRRVWVQEDEYLKRRKKEKEEAERKGAGEDGGNEDDASNAAVCSEEDEEQQEKEFWHTPCSFTPESRLEAHRHLEEKRRAKEKSMVKTEKPSRTLITVDGRVLNVNEPKLDFSLTEDEDNNSIVLDLSVYRPSPCPSHRHMDSSLLDVDIQPTFARVSVKGKVIENLRSISHSSDGRMFQMVLPVEVRPDSSTALRSQTTGHLLLTMPRAKCEIKVTRTAPRPIRRSRSPEDRERRNKVLECLEVNPSRHRALALSSIVPHQETTEGPLEASRTAAPTAAGHDTSSEEFVDDPDVPPLV